LSHALLVLALDYGLPEEFWLEDERRIMTVQAMRRAAADKARGVVDG